jgi:aminoglycoside phosphotransferase
MSDTGVAGERDLFQSQIHATPSRRFLTLFAVWLSRRFRKPRGGIIFLSEKYCIKCRHGVKLSEAHTMQFIAKHTSIPVPRIYCAFVHRNQTYIVMERIHGLPAAVGWVRRSEESKAKILDQLRSMVLEMRSIPPPEGTGVAEVNGGPLFDYRLPGTTDHVGPFKTIEDFHRYLREGLEDHPQHLPEVRELISRHAEYQSAIAFTHGDLSSLNILVSGDKVVGIIDWETAGWYPSYWEYTSAWNVNPQNQFWQCEVEKFLQPLPRELEMEQIRLRYFGDV